MIKVPRKVIALLDAQIEAERRQLSKVQARLHELLEARGQMEPSENNRKDAGAFARAASMSPERRSGIASKAARARWGKEIGEE